MIYGRSAACLTGLVCPVCSCSLRAFLGTRPKRTLLVTGAWHRDLCLHKPQGPSARQPAFWVLQDLLLFSHQRAGSCVLLTGPGQGDDKNPPLPPRWRHKGVAVPRRQRWRLGVLARCVHRLVEWAHALK